MDEGRLENPVFIVGTGRCGSTAVHHLLSYHPRLAWLSRYCDARPYDPGVNRRAMQILDLPLPDLYLRKRIYPTEAYRFWDHYCRGFSEPCRDLLKSDVTPRVKAAVQNVMAQMLTSKRNRILIKVTGWPRIGYLKEIFPDAKFIHIYRDGRAVASSLLLVPWWSGWRGPQNWSWGELTLEHRGKWERFDRSFVALAAIEWEILMSAQEEAASRIPPQDLLKISYEDLCRDPVEMMRRALDFSQLEWTPSFEKRVRQVGFENRNHKWRENLDTAQQSVLNECLYDALCRYGYVCTDGR